MAPEREVTQVDNTTAARARAMAAKDTAPEAPSTKFASFPPSAPPPPARVSEPVAKVVIQDHISVRPPPPPPPLSSTRPTPPLGMQAPPPPSGRQAPPLPPAPPLGMQAPPSVPPPNSDRDAARSATTLIKHRSSPPPPAPSFGPALAQRVRFAGGEVPLWTLITPLVLIVALGAAFAAAAVAGGTPSANKLEPSAEPSSKVGALPIALPSPSQPSLSPTNADSGKPASLIDRAASGDDAELSVSDALALSVGHSAQELRAARALRDKLGHDPGLVKDAGVLGDLRRFADDPETAPEALAAMAEVPGPISADMIYEIWTDTVAHTTATDLARSLMYSKDVRAKASPQLAIALDLRNAEKCEEFQTLLPKATELGDKRSFHLLAKLTRKYGCGPGKRGDCYACLRDDKTVLDNAMKVVKARKEPKPFGN
jgi:hypothetical protein